MISLVVTAGTFVVMQLWVAPALPVSLTDAPQLVGLMPDQARGLTEPTGLLLIIDGQREPDSDKIAPGTIFEQRPLHGSRLRRGSEVHATLALPITRVAIPAVAGQALAAAQKALVDAGLKPGAVTEVVSPTVPPGMVVQTEPPGGGQARHGDTVALQVSKASDQIAVPSLRGRSTGSARQALEAAGLVLGGVGKGSDDNAADGVVLRQDPAPGTLVAKGQKVSIVIND